MAFNFIENKFKKQIKKIQSKGILNEENINEVLQEIRIILIESDVSLKVVDSFIEHIKEKSIGQVVDLGKTTSQELLKIINEELIMILGKTTKEFKHPKPTIVMMMGLQGSGKTTSTSKIANYLVNKTKQYTRPLFIGLDVYRPAAMEQLQKLASNLGFDTHIEFDNKNPINILNNALNKPNINDYDLIILDTAGRLQTDDQLMNELSEIKQIAKPNETIFVLDALAGQEMINVVNEFNTKLSIDSLFVTKLDSSAKGGAILSVSYLYKIPIKFIGVGEKVGQIEVFHPDRIASRILGLGDIKTLTEKAQEISSESENERMMRKMMSGKYDLDDLMTSLEQVKKMGNIKSITKLLPGAKISESQVNDAEEKVYYFKILMSSMTLKERQNPKLLKHPKRRDRIINGSGRNIKEYNDLIRQFEKSQKQMKAVVKMIKSGKMPPGFGTPGMEG